MARGKEGQAPPHGLDNLRLMNHKQKKSLLTLISLDAENLFRRILDKQEESLMILNFKRTRKHFEDLFQSKYGQMSVHDLKELKESTIYALGHFYEEVAELKWYLLHTQELPAMIHDHTTAAIKKLNISFNELMQNIETELEGEDKGKDEEPPPLDFKD